ncbi:DUF5990 family protein [Streptomyces sp. NPDC059009]|uniref:DUF5990 family protein n=1 Tax=Streptomyces sp. NPDC059009 TaxID=3346694 RepID=UPI0036C8A0A4
MPDTLRLRLTGHNLPGTDCGEYRHVRVAIQHGRDPEAPVPGNAPQATWDLTITTVTTPDGTPDFRGPYVHGPRGARFLYLTWGELPPGGTFTMFRRAKLYLADLPGEALEQGEAHGELGLTDPHGMPLCAAVRPPHITWRAHREPQ